MIAIIILGIICLIDINIIANQRAEVEAWKQAYEKLEDIHRELKNG